MTDENNSGQFENKSDNEEQNLTGGEADSSGFGTDQGSSDSPEGQYGNSGSGEEQSNSGGFGNDDS